MRRALITFVLSGFLAGSLATQPNLLDQIWSLVLSWSSPDAGCGMDPNGNCQPALPAQTDEGCGMDPSGGCRPAPQVDAGCGMDPDGCPQGS